MSINITEWASGPSHKKSEMPPLADVAEMIRAGEFVEDIAATFDRAPRTVRDAMRRAGWDPDTGFELAPIALDFDEISTVVTDASWMSAALCAQIDPEPFFPEKGGIPQLGKALCQGCPVREDCLEWALANDERHGVWGGLSESERRALVPTAGAVA